MSHARLPLLLAALVSTTAACGKRDRPGGAPSPIQAESSRAAPKGASPAPPVAPEAPRARVADTKLPLNVFLVSHYHPDPPMAAAPEPDDVKLRVFDVGGQMVVGPLFAVLKNGALDDPPKGFDPDDFPGGDWKDRTTGANWVGIEQMMGSYPNDLWVAGHGTWGIVAARADYPIDHSYVWRREYGRWGRTSDMPAGAAPWSHGRTLAVMQSGRFLLASPRKGKLGDLPAHATGSDGHPRMRAAAMTALRSGAVAIVGPDNDAGGRLAIESWDGDEGEALTTSHVTALPVTETSPPTQAWIFMTKARTLVVANFKGTSPAEGSSFAAEVVAGQPPRRLPLPVTHVDAADVAPDGTLFVARGPDLYRHEGAGVFTQAAPPTPLREIAGVFAESRDKVYAGAFTSAGASLVLWAGEAKEPLPAPPAPTASPAPAGSAATAEDLLKAFPALAAGCATPFVVFFPVSKKTPPDYAFPQTRATLKDFAALAKLRVVDFRTDGNRFVGATAPDVETANALSQHWNDRDEKSKSRPACFAPPADARTVAMP